MITVANRIYVKPEYGEAFEKVFRERAKLVDEMPGFVSNQVLRPVNDGEPYVVFTIWNSRDVQRIRFTRRAVALDRRLSGR